MSMPDYIFCFLAGAVLGFLANEFADRWGCSRRYQSPLPKKLFIVFISGIGAAWLYWWEVECLMLKPPALQCSGIMKAIVLKNGGIILPDEITYIAHLILFVLLLAATLTDFYEMVIPDSITVIGTFVALFTASLSLETELPVTVMYWTDYSIYPILDDDVYRMTVWSPNWPDFKLFETYSLLLMIPLWWFWCFAMLDRVWYTRLPIRKAHAIFWRYLYRSPRTKYIVAAALIVPCFFAWVCSPASNFALFSALVGMAAGMILVWSIRLVAHYVLGIEAMGFGDVTLMGMIGAFLGWQAVLLIFFAAPFFGLIYGIIHWVLGRGSAVPYGPFLCMAAVVVVIAWSPIWSATAEYFSFGIGIIGIGLLVLLVLFAGLLHVVHKIMLRLR